MPHNTDEATDFKADLNELDESSQNEYKIYSRHILEPHRIGPNQSQYNYPTNDLRDGIREF